MKKFFRFLLNPPLYVILINWAFTLIFVACSIILVCTAKSGVLVYVVYTLSAVSLAYSIYNTVKFAPSIKSRILQKIKSKPFTKTLTENYGYRTLFFGVISFIINLAFVAFNTALAFIYKTPWYGAVALYYLLLSALKCWVFLAENKTIPDKSERLLVQLKTYKLCGIAILVFDLAMCAVVALLVMQYKPTKYSQIVAITFAAYTCYKLTFAIVNAVKAQKHDNLHLQIFRNIGLCDGAISLISLQLALVNTFSKTPEQMIALNAITGFAVCAFAIILGISMIVFSVKKQADFIKTQK